MRHGTQLISKTFKINTNVRIDQIAKLLELQINLQLISFLLATASGAGFAVTYELRTYVGHGLEGYGQTRKFLDIVYVSIGL